MDQQAEIARDRINAVLEELMDLLIPRECDNPHCDHDHDIPQGSWMLGNWAMAIDFLAEGIEEVESWTVCVKSKNCPRTQVVVFGATLFHSGF